MCCEASPHSLILAALWIDYNQRRQDEKTRQQNKHYHYFWKYFE